MIVVTVLLAALGGGEKIGSKSRSTARGANLLPVVQDAATLPA